MVPQTSEEIAEAARRAVDRLSARLAADRASTARDDDAARGRAGVAALDAVLEAADALKARLVGRAGPTSEAESHGSHA